MFEILVTRAIVSGIITLIAFFIIRKKSRETIKKDLFVILTCSFIYGFLFDLVDSNGQITFTMEILLIFILVMVHEFGHVCFGYLVGGKLKRVKIGFGLRLFKIGKIEIHLIPFIGMVYMDDIKGKRNTLLYYAGGLIFQLIFIVFFMLLRLVYMDTVYTHVGELMFTAFFVFNALPIYPELDGARILSLLKKSSAEEL